MVDIGAGTMDILYFDNESPQHYKAVVKSPVQTVAERAAGLPGNLVVTGSEMGGGPITEVLRERAGQAQVVMSVAAAATLSHRPVFFRHRGIQVVDDAAAEEMARRSEYTHLILEDLETERLRHIVTSFGVPFEFEAVAVCAQDHGVPPPGTSHLVYRHQINCKVLERDPLPHALFYRGSEVPVTLNRLRSIAASAAKLPTDEVYVWTAAWRPFSVRPSMRWPVPGKMSWCSTSPPLTQSGLRCRAASWPVFSSTTPVTSR